MAAVPLEEVLANWRERASALRLCGHRAEAETIEGICDEVGAAGEDWLRWLSEDEARLRSGRSLDWLRARFAEWEQEGHAEKGPGGRRTYRQCVVPRRGDGAAAREAGLRGERPPSARRVG